MSGVIFDITNPNIGEVEIELNGTKFKPISGLEGVGSYCTHVASGAEQMHRAVVSFNALDAEGIPTEELLGNINIRVGGTQQVGFDINNTWVEGTLKHQPVEQQTNA